MGVVRWLDRIDPVKYGAAGEVISATSVEKLSDVMAACERLGVKADEDTLDCFRDALDEGDDMQGLISALAEAANPMERERMLDSARLKMVDTFAGVDPFSTDAALAYLAALLILDRWDVGETADVAKMLEVFA